VKRAFAFLNAAVAMAMLDLISRVHCYRLSRRQFSRMPLSLNLVVGVISCSSAEGRLPAVLDCLKHLLYISPTSPLYCLDCGLVDSGHQQATALLNRLQTVMERFTASEEIYG